MNTTCRIRILLISPYFYPHIGGSQRYMEELYVHLTEQFPRVSVDVLTYNTLLSSTREKHRGITIYRIPCWEILPGQFALPNPIALLAILYKFASNHYTCVHTHLRFFDAAWWAWLYARIIGATSIFTEHVASRPVHENPTVELIANLINQTLAAWSLPRYDVITTTNRSAQQFLNRTYRLHQTIHVIYGGVDTVYFHPIKRANRVVPVIHKHIKASDTVISFVGRLIWAKGAIRIYTLFRKLLPKIKQSVYLVIAGDGPQAESLKKQIRQDGMTHRVLFLGALNPKEVRSLFQASDIFVHPSHHNEGFPNVILEAGATGNYIIATDIAGVKEVIIPYQTGALVPTGNEKAITRKLLWALLHKTRARRIGNNLRNLLTKQFDWRKISKEYMSLITDTVG